MKTTTRTNLYTVVPNIGAVGYGNIRIRKPVFPSGYDEFLYEMQSVVVFNGKRSKTGGIIGRASARMQRLCIMANR